MTRQGRGGSRKGRAYPRIACPTCGGKFGSNVIRQHLRKVHGAERHLSASGTAHSPWCSFSGADPAACPVCKPSIP